MNVTIKTPEEQEKMRLAGRLAASVLDMIEPFVQPGVSTLELDKRCHDFIVDELQSIPANLNYRGFPNTICTSVNNVVCHGIPGDKRLKNGDIVNIDVTVIRDGFHRGLTWAISATRSRASPRARIFPSCGSIVGTASVAFTMRIRRYCITASRTPVWNSSRA